MQTKVFGTKGEIIASNYLKTKGYKILETNYKNKIGEIDVVALDNDTLVFVEVKTRLSQKFGHPLEAVNYYKQEKIRKVAEFYIIQHKLQNKDARFDVVAILGDQDEQIEHVVDAF